jgi:hypothetical protein
MAFWLAPAQALEAGRIARLPPMGAAEVEAAAPGTAVLVTGILEGNEPALPGYDFVAYSEEAWQVTTPAADDGDSATPTGRWQSLGSVVPELSLAVDGATLTLQAAQDARLTGDLREVIEAREGGVTARFEGDPLADGSRRYRGLADGDLTTVLGTKATSGGVTPEHLYGGDRAAFETSQRNAASGLLYSGLCAVALSPVVLVGGLLAAVFGRRR